MRVHKINLKINKRDIPKETFSTKIFYKKLGMDNYSSSKLDAIVFFLGNNYM